MNNNYSCDLFFAKLVSVFKVKMTLVGVKKKYCCDFLYKRHPEQPESFKQYKWPMFLKLSFMEMKNTPKFAFASDT